jgi:nitrate/TMAO reductase-like tetraheme cytochrome c subunit
LYDSLRGEGFACENENIVHNVESTTAIDTKLSSTKYLALSLVKLQESCTLSCKTEQTVFDNLRTSVEMSENSAKANVQAVCHDCNIAPDTEADLVLAVSSGEFTDAFNELSTDYRPKNDFKTELEFCRAYC